MEKERMSVRSSDEKHLLKGVVYLPDGEAKGYFQVVHGMREYIGRYDRFMTEMAENGYVCFGFDNLGHGETAEEGEHGYIADNDGWKCLVTDVSLFNKAVRKKYAEKYGNMPCILMGHSMGSFIVRMVAGTYTDVWDKLIIMGTGGTNRLTGLGKRIARNIYKKNGPRFVSDKMEKMAFGSYTKKFERDDEISWLSVDKANRDRYRVDKFCKPKFTISAMLDLLYIQQAANSPIWYRSMRTSKPILLVSGAMDPVGAYSKGVKEVYERLQGMRADVTMKLYEGARHEILNDFCHDEVVKDILEFAAK
ncbi:MAG: lysophospholipase [Parasporobacterium sp.]|nr:lysophospholipase [Parasporobacterium sp.]